MNYGNDDDAIRRPPSQLCNTERQRPSSAMINYNGTNRGMTARRSVSSYSSLRPHTPYQETPKFMTLVHGKTLPPKQKKQVLNPTTSFGHIPKGPMQSPVVVTKPREMPLPVEYRTRAKHLTTFDKDFENSWNDKYTRKNKYSPYKNGMSVLRKSSIVETKKILKKVSRESFQQRALEVEEYNQCIDREYEIEKAYPKGDIIPKKNKFLRVFLTN